MTIRGRILAIDDESNIRRLLTNELEQEGFRVATAATGEQGLELVERECFDLALVDLKLPGMSGIDVIRRIRCMQSPVDAIVITGHGDIDMAVQSMKMGALDFIIKPFKLSKLIPLIDQAVRQKRALEQGGSPGSNTGGGCRQRILCPSPAMQDIYIATKEPEKEQSEKTLGEVEKDHILHVLHKVRGNQSRAAKVLGINRRTLFNKIRKHDIFR